MPSVESTELMRTAGIDLRWNGPHNEIYHVPCRVDRLYPFHSRSLVYASVFDILRFLDTRGIILDFRIIIKGFLSMGGWADG